MFKKCRGKPEECPRNVGVWRVCRLVRHGYGFMIEVAMLHTYLKTHRWCFFSQPSNESTYWSLEGDENWLV